ncbi:MAG: 5'/3'-nucleotidase SurE [Pirellula sp.]|nr:5'/3'-nucleotidase SurE [Pirellula sp.]
MRFLLTNDDGVDAPGLAAMAEVAGEFGEVNIVAPHVELSGCSHRVTVDRPLELQELSSRRYRLDGTPADCVRVALGHLKLDVDFVLAGINPGGNLGADVWISGTVAGVREAALWNVPGIAVSQYRRSREPVDWRRAVNWTRRVLRELLATKLSDGAFWNVNLPDPPPSLLGASTTGRDAEVPTLVHCPLDASRLDVRYETAGDRILYRGRYQDRPRSAGCDVAQCFAGAIAVTRLTAGAL